MTAVAERQEWTWHGNLSAGAQLQAQMDPGPGPVVWVCCAAPSLTQAAEAIIQVDWLILNLATCTLLISAPGRWDGVLARTAALLDRQNDQLDALGDRLRPWTGLPMVTAAVAAVLRCGAEPRERGWRVVTHHDVSLRWIPQAAGGFSRPGFAEALSSGAWRSTLARLGLRDRSSAAPLPAALTAGEPRLWTRRGDALCPVPTAFIPVQLPGQVDQAVGRAMTFPQAEAVSVLEALERESGACVEPGRTFRATSYELDGAVLDPLTLVLPEPGAPGLVSYRADLAIDWVQGFSLRAHAPVWVPARAALLNYDNDPPYLRETSNGFALGTSPAEAMLHALFELIERDAFLMTWYARRPSQLLDLEADAPRELMLLSDLCERLGYRLRAYRTTGDSGVPSVWVMAVAQPGSSGQSGRPHLHALAGAHLNPIQALMSGALEVVTSLFLNARLYDPVRAERCRSAPDAVHGPVDHFNRFGHPGSFVQLGFLSETPVGIKEAFAGDLHAGQPLGEALDTVVTRMLDHHPDVVFVDTTSPGLRHQGLCCVRAIVPGLLPLTFGHRHRRVQGCLRLQRAWATQGVTAEALTASGEPWAAPHPFG